MNIAAINQNVGNSTITITIPALKNADYTC